ncbi:MAG TPA: hypothetical protein VML01_13905 [Bryobacterales bacterium]|nr:hypothetical protein [Bryobacterales bacterium]
MPAPRNMSLEREALADPWQVYILRLPGFPVAESALDPMRIFLERLSALIAKDWKLTQEVLVQLDRLQVADAAARFSENGAAWIPEIGLAVWPDRKPPAQWTMKEFLDFIPGSAPVLMYQYLRISKTPEAKDHARNTMLGYGAVSQMFSAGDFDALKKKGEEILLPTIKDPSFRGHPFYLPIFDVKALRSASARQLDEWSCGVTVYIRESPEDKALFIASRQPLEPLLQKLGGKADELSSKQWHVPVGN